MLLGVFVRRCWTHYEGLTEDRVYHSVLLLVGWSSIKSLRRAVVLCTVGKHRCDRDPYKSREYLFFAGTAILQLDKFYGQAYDSAYLNSDANIRYIRR